MSKTRTNLRYITRFACIIMMMQAGLSPSIAAASCQTGQDTKKTTYSLNLLHEPERTNVLKFEDGQGLITFEVFINERRVWAILDNGAGRTIIDTDLAGELGLRVQKNSNTLKTTHSEIAQNSVDDACLVVPGQFQIKGLSQMLRYI